MTGSLSKSTRASYKRSWIHFKQFCILYRRLSCPAATATLLLYIAFCVDQGHAYASILSRISAIAYVHKFKNVIDNSHNFLVRKTLAGVRNLIHKPDSKGAISFDLLQNICEVLPRLSLGYYRLLLFRAMFLLAFHAFLRVGEFTVTTSNAKNVLHIDQIHFKTKCKSIVGVLINFKWYKHSKGKPFALFILPTNSKFCVVKILWQYVKARPVHCGPLFIFQDGKPVSSTYFNTILKSCVMLAQGFNTNFSAHSLRIGAATYCLSKGYTKDQISKMGRWNSQAVEKYFRVQSFTV